MFRFSSLLVGAAAMVLSCGDPTGGGPWVSAPEASMNTLAKRPASRKAVRTVAQNSKLLRCSPLPYDSVTATIGPAGGELKVGPHKLTLEPGALYTWVSITAVAPSDDVNRVELRPEGLRFARLAELMMSYKNCSLAGVKEPRWVVYTDHSLQILEYLPGHDNANAWWVTGQLEHFSNYAVAY